MTLMIKNEIKNELKNEIENEVKIVNLKIKILI